MPFLTIAGVTYNTLTENAGEDEPAAGGLLVEWAWDSTPQVTYAPPRRARHFTLEPMTEATEQTLRNNIALGPVLVGGDAMGAGGTKSCIVTIVSSDYLDNAQLGHFRMPTVNVIQATA